ncbi:hemolysin D [Haloferula helveola]|uniref:Hemolysin D n=1 Tax=Haloferula helveola TaxID=490095 RepID=A0ABN6H2J2_9BACT|nr:hemolysin D [Haloferula helveola]
MNCRYLLLSLLAAPLTAGELTLETKPFRIEHKFQATVLPTEPAVFSIESEVWSEFVIESLADHGSAVKEGDPVVVFKRENYDRRVEDLERAVALQELAVAKQQLEFSKLAEEQKIQMESARRAMETASEDLKYFKEIGRPAAEAEIEQGLVISRFRLASAEEELKQLKQMYEEDDLTEETEEIILKRQQVQVDDSKFDLKQAERQAERSLKISLPRQQESLERAAAQAAIAFSKTEKTLPADLESAQLELKGAELGLARQKLELERLKKDGTLLEWKAPAAGIVFHGGLEGDSWDYGDLGKVLKVGSAVPQRKTLVSITPADGGVRMSAKVDPAVADTLKKGEALTLRVPGGGGGDPVGTITEITTVPGPDGKQVATLAAEWEAGQAPKVGTSVECIRVAYTHPEALAVPSGALVATADGGWSVEVKLADGKTESRAVKRGPTDGKLVQVREGLEPGQVVVVPE